jgi:hypothetical protein
MYILLFRHIFDLQLNLQLSYLAGSRSIPIKTDLIAYVARRPPFGRLPYYIGTGLFLIKKNLMMS